MKTTEKGKVMDPDTDAGRLVASGEALVRLENDTQMMIATQRPRNEKAILAACVEEVETYPLCAETAIYSKPVGRAKECPKCKADTWYKSECPKCGEPIPQTYARGLSIRAAESLANRWDNSAWGCQVLSEDDDGVNVVAIFMDYERNTRRAIPRRISRWYKSRGGDRTRIADDRFNDLVVPANMSRILREVILRSLPAGLKAEYRMRVERALESTTPEAIKRMLSAFAEVKVTRKMLETYLGKSVDTVSKSDMVDLRGICNAIEAGETTSNEAFGPETGGTAEKQNAQAPGAASATEVLDKGKAATPPVTAATAPATAGELTAAQLVELIEDAKFNGTVKPSALAKACKAIGLNPDKLSECGQEDQPLLKALRGLLKI